MKENKVVIFTTFYVFDVGYSLCHCVEDQIRMFVNNGYKIKVLVDEAFVSPGRYWDNPNVTYGRLPSVQRSNEGFLNENWKEESEKMYEALKKELDGYKVVLAHDVILQPAHLIHNIASRKLADERPDLRWLHWSHSSSAPSVRCNNVEVTALIKRKFPNAFLVHPNEGDRQRVALNYKIEINEVKCVSHPSDFAALMFGEEINFNEVPNLSEEAKKFIDNKINYPIRLSRDLVDEFNILDKDVISCYPCRLDRGKQAEYNIKTMGAIKKMGRSVCLVIFDFHSTGGDKVVYREHLKKIGKEWGLEKDELIFISEWRPDTNYSVPREMIMNIKKISDFHMHPCTSETYSLVVQESMMWRNFCILNRQTPYMKSIYGEKNVLYEPFSSNVDCLTCEDGETKINISNEEIHFRNLANKVLYFIEIANPVINQWRFIRKTKSLNYVFKNQLEPLLYFEKLGK
jgi:hypothetical protein